MSLMKYKPGKSPIIKNLIPGLTERGKIKIGRKGDARQGKNGTYQLPQKLDHFLITTLERGQDDNFNLDVAVHRELGPSPKRIPIRLLFDDLELNFQCRYSCYFGKTLHCSGDGEIGIENNQDGTSKEVACPCHRQDPKFVGDDGNGKGKCKINGTLSCLIDASNSVGGVYKFRTTGYNSTTGIYSSLVLIRSLTGGMLAGIPLEMVIHPKVVTSPTDQKSQTVYVVGVEFPGDVQTLQARTLELAQKNADFRARLAHVEEEARQMISCDAELLDQAGDIVEEFHPEELVATNENAPAELPATAEPAAPTETQPAADNGTQKRGKRRPSSATTQPPAAALPTEPPAPVATDPTVPAAPAPTPTNLNTDLF